MGKIDCRDCTHSATWTYNPELMSFSCLAGHSNHLLGDPELGTVFRFGKLASCLDFKPRKRE